MRLSHVLLIAMAVTACTPSPVESDTASPVESDTGLANAASAQQTVEVACTDPRGCPDLIPSRFWMTAGMMLDTRKFKHSSCAVHEGVVKPGKRRLLRLSSSIANVGVGELIVGGVLDRPDLFHFDECHNHYHFRDIDNFRLWQPLNYVQWVALRAAHPSIPSAQLLASHPHLAHQVVHGLKRHICMSEYFHCEPAFGCAPGQTIEPSTHPLIDPNTCLNNEGISVGWMDVYTALLDGQWVEAPNQGGTFIIEHEINAERIIEESNYLNNSAAVCVNIPPKHDPHHHFVGNPNCITPPQFQEATNCEMCLAVCAAMDNAGAVQNECPCEPLYCPDPPTPPP